MSEGAGGPGCASAPFLYTGMAGAWELVARFGSQNVVKLGGQCYPLFELEF